MSFFVVPDLRRGHRDVEIDLARPSVLGVDRPRHPGVACVDQGGEDDQVDRPLGSAQSKRCELIERLSDPKSQPSLTVEEIDLVDGRVGLDRFDYRLVVRPEAADETEASHSPAPSASTRSSAAA